ncbi:MAG: ATP-binding protein [Saprospiraceae bacterium]
MKITTLNSLSQIKNLFYYFDEIKRWLFFGLFLPLIICFIVMGWDHRVLLFILMGYAAALVGFLFAKTPVGKVLLAAEEDLYHRLVVRAKSEIAMVHDLESGRNVFITPSVRAVLGYQPHHIISRYCTFLFHPEDRKKMMQLLSEKSITSSSKLSTRLRVMQKGKGYKWMTFTVHKPDAVFGQEKYAVCTLTDAQKQQEMEKASRMYISELMRKDPAIVLENGTSDQMLGLMTAHELKEPIRTIQSYVQLLEMRHRKGLNAEAKECLHFVGASVHKLNHIVDDIESMFHIDSKQTVITKVNTQKLVLNTIKILGGKIRDREAGVITGMLPEIKGDPNQLRYVFQNLIDNALTFNEGKPDIRITARLQSDSWVFSVKDNGIGISPKYKDQIFEAFRRLHGPQEFGGGSGMGLSICKKIVENHGGRIWLESAGGGSGAAFSFAIPVNPDARKSFDLN